jgi:hypothetical protein
VIAKWTKKSDMVKKQRSVTDFNEIICLTENETLIHKLETHFKSKVVKVGQNVFERGSYQNDYIIFDRNYISVNEIISLMKKFSTSENYFRIKPLNIDVLLGSDSSTSQGEVIIL